MFKLKMYITLRTCMSLGGLRLGILAAMAGTGEADTGLGLAAAFLEVLGLLLA